MKIMPNTVKNPEISIVIPVYNVERFLRKCLETLEAQTFQSFEIIAVNDGSPDGCLKILQEFEAKYDNITVLSQKNQGMSAARNTGMAVARGKYLCFVDSDDYVAPNYLEELYNAITQNDADIACCYYYYHFVNSDVLYKYPFRCEGVYSRGEALNKLLHDTQIQSLVWNKIYRRSIFTENNITFPSMAFEDMATANRIFANAEKVVVINKALYYYNQQNTSTLATINAAKINDFIRATAMVRINLESAGVYSDYQKAYHALSRKTCLCCFYYVVKMHYRKKSMKGALTNMKRVARAIRHYAGDDFTHTQVFRELPDVVDTPEDLRGNTV